MNTLQKLRTQYTPPIPHQLKELAKLVVDKKGHISIPKEVEEKFPHLHAPQIVSFKKGEEIGGPLKVGIVFSGGPAPGGHNVVAAVFDALQAFHPQSALIGFLQGPSGIIENHFKPLDASIIQPFRNQGGFDLLSSGRTKIETEDQLKKALHTVETHGLNGLIIVGGDDSNTNAAILANYFAEKGNKTAVVGVPKTIDGDLKNTWIEASFGFDTAAKTYSQLVGNILKDALSQEKYYFFIKLMGRTASHLILECALQTHPNLALISEEIHEQKKTLQQIVSTIADLIVLRASAGKNYGVILIPEGIIEALHDVDTFLPPEIKEQMALERDPHGNLQVSKIESERLLIQLVTLELKKRSDYQGKWNPQPLFFGYEGRSCLPSNFDCNYCYALGLTAALLVKSSLNGYMAIVNHLIKSPDEWKCLGVPLVAMIELKESKKPVIRKSLVDLKGAPFLAFAGLRNQWELADDYQSPGPIQFYGPKEVTEPVTDTLLYSNA